MAGAEKWWIFFALFFLFSGDLTAGGRGRGVPILARLIDQRVLNDGNRNQNEILSPPPIRFIPSLEEAFRAYATRHPFRRQLLNSLGATKENEKTRFTLEDLAAVRYFNNFLKVEFMKKNGDGETQPIPPAKEIPVVQPLPSRIDGKEEIKEPHDVNGAKDSGGEKTSENKDKKVASRGHREEEIYMSRRKHTPIKGSSRVITTEEKEFNNHKGTTNPPKYSRFPPTVVKEEQTTSSSTQLGKNTSKEKNLTAITEKTEISTERSNEPFTEKANEKGQLASNKKEHREVSKDDGPGLPSKTSHGYPEVQNTENESNGNLKIEETSASRKANQEATERTPESINVQESVINQDTVATEEEAKVANEESSNTHIRDENEEQNINQTIKATIVGGKEGEIESNIEETSINDATINKEEAQATTNRRNGYNRELQNGEVRLRIDESNDEETRIIPDHPDGQTPSYRRNVRNRKANNEEETFRIKERKEETVAAVNTPSNRRKGRARRIQSEEAQLRIDRSKEGIVRTQNEETQGINTNPKINSDYIPGRRRGNKHELTNVEEKLLILNIEDNTKTQSLFKNDAGLNVGNQELKNIDDKPHLLNKEDNIQKNNEEIPDNIKIRTEDQPSARRRGYIREIKNTQHLTSKQETHKEETQGSSGSIKLKKEDVTASNSRSKESNREKNVEASSNEDNSNARNEETQGITDDNKMKNENLQSETVRSKEYNGNINPKEAELNTDRINGDGSNPQKEDNYGVNGNIRGNNEEVQFNRKIQNGEVQWTLKGEDETSQVKNEDEGNNNTENGTKQTDVDRNQKDRAKLVMSEENQVNKERGIQFAPATRRRVKKPQPENDEVTAVARTNLKEVEETTMSHITARSGRRRGRARYEAKTIITRDVKKQTEQQTFDNDYLGKEGQSIEDALKSKEEILENQTLSHSRLTINSTEVEGSKMEIEETNTNLKNNNIDMTQITAIEEIQEDAGETVTESSFKEGSVSKQFPTSSVISANEEDVQSINTNENHTLEETGIAHTIDVNGNSKNERLILKNKEETITESTIPPTNDSMLTNQEEIDILRGIEESMLRTKPPTEKERADFTGFEEITNRDEIITNPADETVLQGRRNIGRRRKIISTPDNANPGTVVIGNPIVPAQVIPVLGKEEEGAITGGDLSRRLVIPEEHTNPSRKTGGIDESQIVLNPGTISATTTMEEGKSTNEEIQHEIKSNKQGVDLNHGEEIRNVNTSDKPIVYKRRNVSRRRKIVATSSPEINLQKPKEGVSNEKVSIGLEETSISSIKTTPEIEPTISLKPADGMSNNNETKPMDPVLQTDEERNIQRNLMKNEEYPAAPSHIISGEETTNRVSKPNTSYKYGEGIRRNPSGEDTANIEKRYNSEEEIIAEKRNPNQSVDVKTTDVMLKKESADEPVLHKRRNIKRRRKIVRTTSQSPPTINVKNLKEERQLETTTIAVLQTTKSSGTILGFISNSSNKIDNVEQEKSKVNRNHRFRPTQEISRDQPILHKRRNLSRRRKTARTTTSPPDSNLRNSKNKKEMYTNKIEEITTDNSATQGNDTHVNLGNLFNDTKSGPEEDTIKDIKKSTKTSDTLFKPKSSLEGDGFEGKLGNTNELIEEHSLSREEIRNDTANVTRESYVLQMEDKIRHAFHTDNGQNLGSSVESTDNTSELPQAHDVLQKGEEMGNGVISPNEVNLGAGSTPKDIIGSVVIPTQVIPVLETEEETTKAELSQYRANQGISINTIESETEQILPPNPTLGSILKPNEILSNPLEVLQSKPDLQREDIQTKHSNLATGVNLGVNVSAGVHQIEKEENVETLIPNPGLDADSDPTDNLDSWKTTVQQTEKVGTSSKLPNILKPDENLAATVKPSRTEPVKQVADERRKMKTSTPQRSQSITHETSTTRSRTTNNNFDNGGDVILHKRRNISKRRKITTSNLETFQPTSDHPNPSSRSKPKPINESTDLRREEERRDADEEIKVREFDTPLPYRSLGLNFQRTTDLNPHHVSTEANLGVSTQAVAAVLDGMTNKTVGGVFATDITVIDEKKNVKVVAEEIKKPDIESSTLKQFEDIQVLEEKQEFRKESNLNIPDAVENKALVVAENLTVYGSTESNNADLGLGIDDRDENDLHKNEERRKVESNLQGRNPLPERRHGQPTRGREVEKNEERRNSKIPEEINQPTHTIPSVSAKYNPEIPTDVRRIQETSTVNTDNYKQEESNKESWQSFGKVQAEITLLTSDTRRNGNKTEIKEENQTISNTTPDSLPQDGKPAGVLRRKGGGPKYSEGSKLETTTHTRRRSGAKVRETPTRWSNLHSSNDRMKVVRRRKGGKVTTETYVIPNRITIKEDKLFSNEEISKSREGTGDSNKETVEGEVLAVETAPLPPRKDNDKQIEEEQTATEPMRRNPGEEEQTATEPKRRNPDEEEQTAAELKRRNPGEEIKTTTDARITTKGKRRRKIMRVRGINEERKVRKEVKIHQISAEDTDIPSPSEIIRSTTKSDLQKQINITETVGRKSGSSQEHSTEVVNLERTSDKEDGIGAIINIKIPVITEDSKENQRRKEATTESNTNEDTETNINEEAETKRNKEKETNRNEETQTVVLGVSTDEVDTSKELESTTLKNEAMTLGKLQNVISAEENSTIEADFLLREETGIVLNRRLSVPVDYPGANSEKTEGVTTELEGLIREEKVPLSKEEIYVAKQEGNKQVKKQSEEKKHILPEDELLVREESGSNIHRDLSPRAESSEENNEYRRRRMRGERRNTPTEATSLDTSNENTPVIRGRGGRRNFQTRESSYSTTSKSNEDAFEENNVPLQRRKGKEERSQSEAVKSETSEETLVGGKRLNIEESNQKLNNTFVEETLAPSEIEDQQGPRNGHSNPLLLNKNINRDSTVTEEEINIESNQSSKPEVLFGNQKEGEVQQLHGAEDVPRIETNARSLAASVGVQNEEAAVDRTRVEGRRNVGRGLVRRNEAVSPDFVRNYGEESRRKTQLVEDITLEIKDAPLVGRGEGIRRSSRGRVKQNDYDVTSNQNKEGTMESDTFTGPAIEENDDPTASKILLNNVAASNTTNEGNGRIFKSPSSQQNEDENERIFTSPSSQQNEEDLFKPIQENINSEVTEEISNYPSKLIGDSPLYTSESSGDQSGNEERRNAGTKTNGGRNDNDEVTPVSADLGIKEEAINERRNLRGFSTQTREENTGTSNDFFNRRRKVESKNVINSRTIQNENTNGRIEDVSVKSELKEESRNLINAKTKPNESTSYLQEDRSIGVSSSGTNTNFTNLSTNGEEGTHPNLGGKLSGIQEMQKLENEDKISLVSLPREQNEGRLSAQNKQSATSRGERRNFSGLRNSQRSSIATDSIQIEEKTINRRRNENVSKQKEDPRPSRTRTRTRTSTPAPDKGAEVSRRRNGERRRNPDAVTEATTTPTRQRNEETRSSRRRNRNEETTVATTQNRRNPEGARFQRNEESTVAPSTTARAKINENRRRRLKSRVALLVANPTQAPDFFRIVPKRWKVPPPGVRLPKLKRDPSKEVTRNARRTRRSTEDQVRRKGLIPNVQLITIEDLKKNEERNGGVFYGRGKSDRNAHNGMTRKSDGNVQHGMKRKSMNRLMEDGVNSEDKRMKNELFANQRRNYESLRSSVRKDDESKSFKLLADDTRRNEVDIQLSRSVPFGKNVKPEDLGRNQKVIGNARRHQEVQHDGNNIATSNRGIEDSKAVSHAEIRGVREKGVKNHRNIDDQEQKIGQYADVNIVDTKDDNEHSIPRNKYKIEEEERRSRFRNVNSRKEETPIPNGRRIQRIENRRNNTATSNRGIEDQAKISSVGIGRKRTSSEGTEAFAKENGRRIEEDDIGDLKKSSNVGIGRKFEEDWRSVETEETEIGKVANLGIRRKVEEDGSRGVEKEETDIDKVSHLGIRRKVKEGASRSVKKEETDVGEVDNVGIRRNVDKDGNRSGKNEETDIGKVSNHGIGRKFEDHGSRSVKKEESDIATVGNLGIRRRNGKDESRNAKKEYDIGEGVNIGITREIEESGSRRINKEETDITKVGNAGIRSKVEESGSRSNNKEETDIAKVDNVGIRRKVEEGGSLSIKEEQTDIGKVGKVEIRRNVQEDGSRNVKKEEDDIGKVGNDGIRRKVKEHASESVEKEETARKQRINGNLQEVNKRRLKESVTKGDKAYDESGRKSGKRNRQRNEKYLNHGAENSRSLEFQEGGTSKTDEDVGRNLRIEEDGNLKKDGDGSHKYLSSNARRNLNNEERQRNYEESGYNQHFDRHANRNVEAEEGSDGEKSKIVESGRNDEGRITIGGYNRNIDTYSNRNVAAQEGSDRRKSKNEERERNNEGSITIGGHNRKIERFSNRNVDIGKVGNDAEGSRGRSKIEEGKRNDEGSITVSGRNRNFVRYSNRNVAAQEGSDGIKSKNKERGRNDDGGISISGYNRKIERFSNRNIEAAEEGSGGRTRKIEERGRNDDKISLYIDGNMYQRNAKYLNIDSNIDVGKTVTTEEDSRLIFNIDGRNHQRSENVARNRNIEENGESSNPNINGNNKKLEGRLSIKNKSEEVRRKQEEIENEKTKMEAGYHKNIAVIATNTYSFKTEPEVINADEQSPAGKSLHPSAYLSNVFDQKDQTILTFEQNIPNRPTSDYRPILLQSTYFVPAYPIRPQSSRLPIRQNNHQTLTTVQHENTRGTTEPIRQQNSRLPNKQSNYQTPTTIQHENTGGTTEPIRQQNSRLPNKQSNHQIPTTVQHENTRGTTEPTRQQNTRLPNNQSNHQTPTTVQHENTRGTMEKVIPTTSRYKEAITTTKRGEEKIPLSANNNFEFSTLQTPYAYLDSKMRPNQGKRRTTTVSTVESSPTETKKPHRVSEQAANTVVRDEKSRTKSEVETTTATHRRIPTGDSVREDGGVFNDNAEGSAPTGESSQLENRRKVTKTSKITHDDGRKRTTLAPKTSTVQVEKRRKTTTPRNLVGAVETEKNHEFPSELENQNSKITHEGGRRRTTLAPNTSTFQVEKRRKTTTPRNMVGADDITAETEKNQEFRRKTTESASNVHITARPGTKSNQDNPREVTEVSRIITTARPATEKHQDIRRKQTESSKISPIIEENQEGRRKATRVATTTEKLERRRKTSTPRVEATTHEGSPRTRIKTKQVMEISKQNKRGTTAIPRRGNTTTNQNHRSKIKPTHGINSYDSSANIQTTTVSPRVKTAGLRKQGRTLSISDDQPDLSTRTDGEFHRKATIDSEHSRTNTERVKTNRFGTDEESIELRKRRPTDPHKVDGAEHGYSRHQSDENVKFAEMSRVESKTLRVEHNGRRQAVGNRGDGKWRPEVGSPGKTLES